MRMFIAGATGAVGRRLVPLALRAGHRVTGMTRSEDKAGELRAAGAEAAVADALDRAAVVTAVAKAAPEVVVHQLTALSLFSNMRRFDREFEATNLRRTQGTTNLVAAAQASGARRLVAQSFAGWPYARTGGLVKTEDDELDPDPAVKFRGTLEAICYLEHTVLTAEGIEGAVLRYGWFYGPGTSLGAGGKYLEVIHRRQFPIIGDGTGVWSFIHIDDVAAATLAAIERGAAAAHPGLARQTADRRTRADADERGTRCVQFQGQARARLAAALRELARGFPDRARRLAAIATRGVRRGDGLRLWG